MMSPVDDGEDEGEYETLYKEQSNLKKLLTVMTYGIKIGAQKLETSKLSLT